MKMTDMFDAEAVFDHLPGCYLILAPNPPDFTILAVNQAYLEATGMTHSIIGKSMFRVFPDNPRQAQASGQKNLTASLLKVLETRSPHRMAIQRYDTSGDGIHYQLHFWNPVNIPVLDPGGAIRYIIHSVAEVTDLVLMRKDLQEMDTEKQKQITDAVITTRELERLEISRELHDNINQVLHMARLYIEQGKQNPAGDGKYLDLTLHMIEQAIGEVDKLSEALTHASAEEEDLNSSLERLLKQVAHLKDINIFKKISLPDETLIEAKVKTTVIRILQEQLTNIIRHADARNLYIDLTFKEHQLELTLKDDGRGFDMLNYKKGKGLQNIRTRAAILDGRVLITSFPGDGCQIKVFLPNGRT